MPRKIQPWRSSNQIVVELPVILAEWRDRGEEDSIFSSKIHSDCTSSPKNALKLQSFNHNKAFQVEKSDPHPT